VAILDDTRSDWNARKPLRTLDRVAWTSRVGVSWHWLGDGRGPNVSGSHAKCLEQVRAWQGYHQSSLGWKDIGYNALICQHARAIEGRGLDKEGSHSPGVNTSHVGVQFMVGGGDPFPSAAMTARAVKLRADLAALAPTIRRDWAHRDDPKASTACPGNGITSWVHSGGPTKNAPAPAPAPQEDDMPTTQEVVDGIMAAKAIPANMLVDGWKAGDPVNLVPIPRALDLVMRWALEARDNAIVARTVAEAQAQLGRPMTATEVSAAVKSALSEAASIEVVVKKEVTP
jgi:hypothetical protein